MPIPPLVVNEILLVSLRSELFGQTLISDLHYVVGAVPTTAPFTAQMQDLIDTIWNGTDPAGLIDAFVTCQTGQVSYKEIRCQTVYPARSVFVTRTLIDVGLATGISNTANLAVSLQKKTFTGGRMGQGRLQLAGIPTNKIANGVVDPVFLGTSLHDLAIAIKTIQSGDLYGGAYLPCIFNPTSADPLKLSVVNDVIPQDTARVMHRRTVRVGV